LTDIVVIGTVFLGLFPEENYTEKHFKCLVIVRVYSRYSIDVLVYGSSATLTFVRQ